MRQEAGSLIGAIGGVLFVEINAGSLPGPAVWPVRILGIVAFAVVVWYAVLRTRSRPASVPEASQRAIRTYWICVVAEVAAIPLGASVLNSVLHRPELVLPWVVFVVGVHFGPFGRAFGLPVLFALSVALVVVALLGGSWTLLGGGALAAGATGVVAGFTMLGFSAAGARRPAERT
jgi:hypothetical protein